MPTADQKLFPTREPGLQLNNRNSLIWGDILREEAKCTRKWEANNTVYGPVDTIEKNTFVGLEKSMLRKEGYFDPAAKTSRRRPATSSSGKRTARPKGVPEGYVWSNVMGGFGGSVGPLNMSQFALAGKGQERPPSPSWVKMDPVLDTHQNTTRGNRTHRSSRSTQRTTSRTRGNDSSRAQDEAGASPSYQMLTTNLVQDLRAVEAKVHRDQAMHERVPYGMDGWQIGSTTPRKTVYANTGPHEGGVWLKWVQPKPRTGRDRGLGMKKEYSVKADIHEDTPMDPVYTHGKLKWRYNNNW